MANNKKDLLFSITHWIGIIGIMISLFTNKFILYITNDEIYGQEKGWIARLVFYIITFISIIYFCR